MDRSKVTISQSIAVDGSIGIPNGPGGHGGPTGHGTRNWSIVSTDHAGSSQNVDSPGFAILE